MRKILFMDVETGGLDRKKHSLLQLSAIYATVDNGIITEIDNFNTYIKHDTYNITVGALRVNGIDITKLESMGAKTEKQAADAFDVFLSKHYSESYGNRYENIYLAGRNPAWDREWVADFMARNDHTKAARSFSQRMTDISTMIFELIDLNKYNGANTSKAAYEFLGIHEEEFHSSIDCCRNSLLSYQKLLDMRKNNKVYVIVEGGIVQNIYTTDANCEALVIDNDIAKQGSVEMTIETDGLKTELTKDIENNTVFKIL